MNFESSKNRDSYVQNTGKQYLTTTTTKLNDFSVKKLENKYYTYNKSEIEVTTYNEVNTTKK